MLCTLCFYTAILFVILILTKITMTNNLTDNFFLDPRT